VPLAILLWVGAVSTVGASPANPLDPSFGDGGVSLTEDSAGIGANALTQDHSGRLLAAGSTSFEHFAVWRYSHDGLLDISFGEGGGVVTSLGFEAAVQEITVQRSGKILAAGKTETAFALVRYNSAGHLDRSFGQGGRIYTPLGVEGASILDLAIQPNGRILAVGYAIDIDRDWSTVLIAYKPNGTIDRCFADHGMLEVKGPAREVSAEFSGIEVLPSGKVLLGGDLAGRLLLMRLLPNGEPDPRFGGGDGRVLVGSRICPCYANALALAPGGKPLVAGVANGSGPSAALLVRFKPSGRIDRSFGKRGEVRTRRGTASLLNDLTLQPNGRITAAGIYANPRTGETQAAVLRYLPSGRPDTSFAHHGFFTRDFGRESVASAALTQPDGRVVIAGRASFGSRPPEERSPLFGGQVLLMRFRAD
jgi:uncharacterized delta-60 repeat protein